MKEKAAQEISTTVITANGRSFLPDLGPMPDAEILYAFARTLDLYIGFEISTHVKLLGLDPSPIYEPRWPSRICIGLCKTKGDVPAMAVNSFEIVNPATETN
ncbi:MAG: hypothetical protein WCD79_18195 [Chthoniobacteraceae bacterium]